MCIHTNNDGVSLSDIAYATNGKLLLNNCRKVHSITTDSRKIEKDSLFIALRGERFDGHDYINQAFLKGAACVLSEKLPNSNDDNLGNIILVDDTLKALGAMAKHYKDTINPLTIAVTGSVGKTTTKEFIYAVLNKKYNTHKTEGNFNNEVGLPLTLLKLEKIHQALVLELGMSFAGEIQRLSQIAEPDIAIITNIGNSHIENLGSRENICEAKLEILSGLKPDGKIILNGDEPLLWNLKSKLSNVFYVAVDNINADVRVTNINEYDGYTTFDLIDKTCTLTDVKIPSIGTHNVYNAAVAYTVGKVVGMDNKTIIDGLYNFKNTGMRQNIYSLNNVNIIEDCYNASPESMKAALDVLAKISSGNGRSIAVLGEMRELGLYSANLHELVGEEVVKHFVDYLFTFGKETENIALGAIKNGFCVNNIFVNVDLENIQLIGDKLLQILKPNDTILFKASRAVKLERVIEYVKEKLNLL